MREMLQAKLHRGVVTDCRLDYAGSLDAYMAEKLAALMQQIENEKSKDYLRYAVASLPVMYPVIWSLEDFNRILDVLETYSYMRADDMLQIAYCLPLNVTDAQRKRLQNVRTSIPGFMERLLWILQYRRHMRDDVLQHR